MMLGRIGAALFGSAAGRKLVAAAMAALTIILFVINLRRAGERAGRAAERLETLERQNDIQKQMLEAAANRPRSRDDLLDRLRGGGF
jgi:hypothetical protein